MQEDNDLELDSEEDKGKPVNRKKLLILILPVLIVIGLSAGLFFVLNSSPSTSGGSYNVVKKSGAEDGAVTVFYDLPEVMTVLKTTDSLDQQRLHIRLNLELRSVEDAATVEILSPKITDAVIAHTIELTPEEVSGSGGLYWLKEELLYRINLITNPIKVDNINFRTFEIETAGSKK